MDVRQNDVLCISKVIYLQIKFVLKYIEFSRTASGTPANGIINKENTRLPPPPRTDGERFRRKQLKKRKTLRRKE